MALSGASRAPQPTNPSTTCLLTEITEQRTQHQQFALHQIKSIIQQQNHGRRRSGQCGSGPVAVRGRRTHTDAVALTKVGAAWAALCGVLVGVAPRCSVLCSVGGEQADHKKQISGSSRFFWSVEKVNSPKPTPLSFGKPRRPDAELSALRAAGSRLDTLAFVRRGGGRVFRK